MEEDGCSEAQVNIEDEEVRTSEAQGNNIIMVIHLLHGYPINCYQH